MQQQRGHRELSNNTNIVIKEADKGGAITIIYKEDYVHDCKLILADNSTYLVTTTDMMETHNEETNDIIGNISSNNRSRISQLFHVKATPGTFYALPKLHKLNRLISTKTNRNMTDGILISTCEQCPLSLHSKTFVCKQVLSQVTHLSLHPHSLDV